MAKIEKPSNSKVTTISQPKATSKAPTTQEKPIQVMLSADKHQEIKIYAAERNMKLKELFMDMYNEYRAKHG